jgi:hypothetical protein
MTGAQFLSIPELDADPRLQADWLELAAFLSESGRVLLTELVNQQDLDQDQEPEDFGDLDELLEDIANKVAAEVDRRRHDLEDAYPFELNEEGEVFSLIDGWNVGQAIYLFCLILSHAPKSVLVPQDYAPDKHQLQEARDLFQVCSTLAAAGHTGGPAFSVGWPRIGGVQFLAKLHDIWRIYGDGIPQDGVPPGTSPQHKDEGIDVISYWPERDGQPGIGYLLGQVASGKEWKTKSIRPEVKAFLRWFKRVPAAPAQPAIFIPFSVDDEAVGRYTMSHGYVAHRLRLPRHAGRAPILSDNGITPIERLNEIGRVYAWLARHRQNVLGSMEP